MKIFRSFSLPRIGILVLITIFLFGMFDATLQVRKLESENQVLLIQLRNANQNRVGVQSEPVVEQDQLEPTTEISSLVALLSEPVETETYTSDDVSYSFSYPVGLFSQAQPNSYWTLESDIGLMFKDTTQMDWGAGDGIYNLDDISDPDHWIRAWLNQQDDFRSIVSGQEPNKKYWFGDEVSYTLAQKVQEIGGRKWIVGVDYNLNGGCGLNYATFINGHQLRFYTEIVDPVCVYESGSSVYQAIEQLNVPNRDRSKAISLNEDLASWTSGILDNQPVNIDTFLKQTVLRQVLESLQEK